MVLSFLSKLSLYIYIKIVKITYCLRINEAECIDYFQIIVLQNTTTKKINFLFKFKNVFIKNKINKHYYNDLK